MTEQEQFSVLIRFYQDEAGGDIPTEYTFDTEAEKVAFLDGLHEGAAMGGFEEVEAGDLAQGSMVRFITGR